MKTQHAVRELENENNDFIINGENENYKNLNKV